MALDILNYSGLLITMSGDYTISGGASDVKAQWNTGYELWDGGPTARYVFWGDTQGTIDVFEFEFASGAATGYTLVTNQAYSGAALTIMVEFDGTNVMEFPDCCYNPGFASKKLRTMGDRLVMEGSVTFKILKINA